jgi:hypothetical protein
MNVRLAREAAGEARDKLADLLDRVAANANNQSLVRRNSRILNALMMTEGTRQPNAAETKQGIGVKRTGIRGHEGAANKDLMPFGCPNDSRALKPDRRNIFRTPQMLARESCKTLAGAPFPC